MAPKPTNTNTRKRRGKDVSGTSTHDPLQPPPPQPLIQPPPYQRFVSEAAEKRYHIIKKFDVNKERGFNFDKLGKYPVFEEKITQRGWEGIVQMVTEESNKTIACEFLANALAEKESDRHAYVRGKRVNYSNEDIDRILGLGTVENCGVEFRRKNSDIYKTRAQWDSLLEGLMREGKGWIGTTERPQRINTAELLPEYKAWASFILTVIAQTSSTAEMVRDKVLILLALLSDDDINVGALMYLSLKELVTTDNLTLGHCCLINKLCKEAGVPEEPSDVYVKSLRPISEGVMRGFQREQEKYDLNLAKEREQQRESQMMEQDNVPEIPPQQMQQQGLPPYFAEYTYAMANWAVDISSRDRMPPPDLPQPFYEAAERYRNSSVARTNAFDRFASPEEMENYFEAERQRGARAEERIRTEYYRIQAERQTDAFTQPMYYPFPPSGPGGSSGAQQ